MKRREKVEKKMVGMRAGVFSVEKSVRGGPSTPVPPWMFEEKQNFIGDDDDAHDSKINKKKFVSVKPSFGNPCSSVSARKLAATLWEFQHYLPLSAKMHRGVNGHHPSSHPSRLRRLHSYLPDPSPSSPDQPESASSLRRHVTASLMQHHRTMERSNHALQPVSPASYGSSMEMAPYNPVSIPSSSIDFKRRNGESSFNLKTSTELLKVLNRIWSLEEQHTSNIALIKALKMELDHTRVKMKDLVRERQSNRQEINDLMKQVTEDKLLKKDKEQDRIKAAVKSVRDELEEERRLRKRSESLHRKLARELTEAKSSLSGSIKEMERERKSRELLEDLCDEFAKGIKDYEQEVHSLRQLCDKDWANRADSDGLILHTSESWLDERMQMKLRESQSGFAEKNSIVDKVSSEIETLIQAKQMDTSKIGDNLLKKDSNENLLRRRSLESVPLNEALSAPQDDVDEDSAGSDTNCFELNKPTAAERKLLGDEDNEFVNNKPVSREKVKARNPSSLQVKFEEQMAWALSRNRSKTKAFSTEHGEEKENPAELTGTQKPEMSENTPYEGKNVQGSNSNSMIDQLIRGQYMSSGSRSMHHPELDLEEGSYGNSIWRSRASASPVQQWRSKLISTDLDVSAMESSTKLHMGVKENSLKAKLLEARYKGHHNHSRMKAPK